MQFLLSDPDWAEVSTSELDSKRLTRRGGGGNCKESGWQCGVRAPTALLVPALPRLRLMTSAFEAARNPGEIGLPEPLDTCG